ncbi:MAG TPA: hypothetical protein VK095_14330 [Beutenbergiaceae bacterium]|nr:hypothetical protein [Beutenbergiaceae bacterium]
MLDTHPDAEEWTEANGEVYARFTDRLDTPPAEMVPGPPPQEILPAAGSDLLSDTQVPVVILVGGP